MIDQLMHVNGSVHASSVFGSDRLHIGPEENHRGAWCPVKESDCYNPNQRYSDYDLAYGMRFQNWPIGLQMQCRKPGHEKETITFDGKNWVNRWGIPRTFGILGKYTKQK
jgi:hypothetical protein